MPELKTCRGALVVKDAAQGLVSAVFADMRPGVVDRDGDTYGPAALRGGVVPVSAWAHGSAYPAGPLPVGKATVRGDGGVATADIEYFLDLPAGREAFEVMRRLGSTEWSWTLDIRKDRPTAAGRHIIDVAALEVSPVLRGAGIGTRTTSAKDCRYELLAAVATVNRLRLSELSGWDRLELSAIRDRLGVSA